jgi:predicted aldo/keto reductase-like oxidoreductase
MRYVEYGRTGKQVSVVGFGGMRFDLSRSREENAELVRYACAQGINYFDTAPGYCNDQSEDIFGEAFKDMPGDFYVSTKGMPVNFDTADKARDAVLRSIERMGVEKINFYHVWCLRKMEHYELAMKPGGQYEGLMRCKEEGLIDHIVCSSHQPGDEITKILEKNEFEGILLGANILNFPYRWNGVLTANEKGCGVVAMNPLAGGAIPQHEKEFAFLAREGETATEAALRFVIAAPQITVALNGFTTKEHVDTACRIADEAEPMTAAELETIRGQLGANMNEVCTGCGYCKDCPQNIPIPAYMQVYNDKVMFGSNDEAMVKAMNHHHNWGILVMRQADAAECIECGQCEEACTQHLPIVSRLTDIAGWEAKL